MSARLVAAAMLIAASLVPVSIGSTAAAGDRAAVQVAERCTIRGTPGRDRLRGTARRDVICGRGGDDVLYGLDGDDVLRGGSGNDVLRGGRGRDRLAGGAGKDRLAGEGEGDLLRGATGRDVLSGGAGVDRLRGGEGSDDIDGGGLGDDIDGGEGFNTCTVDALDVVERCTYDLAPPALVETAFSATNIDVTGDDAVVTVRLHVTDDTGVRAVRLHHPEAWFPAGLAQRVSGSTRDGWWEARLRFRAHSRPGTYVPDVEILDRLGRRTRVDAAASLDVTGDAPDADPPRVVKLLSPLPTDVYEDVGPTYAGVPIRVRVVDDMTGAAEVSFSAHHWTPNGNWSYFAASNMTLVSGTRRDGIWRGRLGLYRHDWSGTWSLHFVVRDKPHVDTLWGAGFGGPTFREHFSTSSQPIPDGRGDFTFVGREPTDAQPPEIVSASIAPTSVSTLERSASISFTVVARDAGSGVSWVSARLTNPSYPSNSFYTSLKRTQGTRRNGTWTGNVVLPRGIAPGEFEPSVSIGDEEHNYSHGSAESLGLPQVTVLDDSPPP